MAAKMICAACGSFTEPRKVTRGSILIEIILWLCLIVPGLIYSLWRMTSRYKVCRWCGSREIIPADTPRGRELISRFHRTP